MIRKANKGDILVILQLLTEGSLAGQVLIRSEEEIKQAINSFYIAEEKGKVLGCCSLEKYSPKLAEVRSLVVKIAYQKKGVGTKLVKHCIKEARKIGVYQLISITDKVDFFENLGFRKKLRNKYPLYLKLKESYI